MTPTGSAGRFVVSEADIDAALTALGASADAYDEIGVSVGTGTAAKFDAVELLIYGSTV